MSPVCCAVGPGPTTWEACVGCVHWLLTGQGFKPLASA